MCPDTGKPYYLAYNQTTQGIEKEYGLPDVQIPSRLRKYLVGRGHLFHAYTDYFNDRDTFKTDVRTFLEEYPSWEMVMESPYYTDDYEDAWNEGNHIAFRELLELLTQQEAVYTVQWSY